jgi:hypothetical protein
MPGLLLRGPPLVVGGLLVLGAFACLTQLPLDAQGYACVSDEECNGEARCLAGHCGGPPSGTATDQLVVPLLKLRSLNNRAERLVVEESRAQETLLDGGWESTGIRMRVATSKASNTSAVYEIYRPDNEDYLYTTSANEVSSAVANYAYQDRGLVFYVSTKGFDGGVAVVRMQRSGTHRYAIGSEEHAALKDGGWAEEYVFGAANPP